jgi:hypothetical protein
LYQGLAGAGIAFFIIDDKNVENTFVELEEAAQQLKDIGVTVVALSPNRLKYTHWAIASEVRRQDLGASSPGMVDLVFPFSVSIMERLLRSVPQLGVILSILSKSFALSRGK